MKCVVVGLGQFGTRLCRELTKAGHEVTAVDEKMELVDEIKDEVALAVRLNATDADELKNQGVSDADILVAAIGNNFEANQLVTVIAKKLGVKRVIARTSSPLHARILKLIGADEVIMPEEEAAIRLTQRIKLPSLQNYFEIAEGYSLVEVKAPESFLGKTIAEIDVRKHYNVNLALIKRVKKFGSDAEEAQYDVIPVLKPTDTVKIGDVLSVIGSDSDIKKMMEELNGSIT